MIGGTIFEWNEDYSDVFSPIVDVSTQQQILVGKMPQMQEATTLQVLEYAQLAWRKGMGDWPQSGARKRIDVVRQLVDELKSIREFLVEILMWEICKSRHDAETEFDRTMTFIEKVIQEYDSLLHREFQIRTFEEFYGKILRCPMGVMLALGPSNYPVK